MERYGITHNGCMVQATGRHQHSEEKRATLHRYLRTFHRSELEPKRKKDNEPAVTDDEILPEIPATTILQQTNPPADVAAAPASVVNNVLDAPNDTDHNYGGAALASKKDPPADVAAAPASVANNVLDAPNATEHNYGGAALPSEEDAADALLNMVILQYCCV